MRPELREQQSEMGSTFFWVWKLNEIRWFCAAAVTVSGSPPAMSFTGTWYSGKADLLNAVSEAQTLGLQIVIEHNFAQTVTTYPAFSQLVVGNLRSSVHHIGPDWNMSFTNRWMDCCDNLWTFMVPPEKVPYLFLQCHRDHFHKFLRPMIQLLYPLLGQLFGTEKGAFTFSPSSHEQQSPTWQLSTQKLLTWLDILAPPSCAFILCSVCTNAQHKGCNSHFLLFAFIIYAV